MWSHEVAPAGAVVVLPVPHPAPAFPARAGCMGTPAVSMRVRRARGDAGARRGRADRDVHILRIVYTFGRDLPELVSGHRSSS